MVNVTEKAPPAYVARKDPKDTAFTVAVKMHFGNQFGNYLCRKILPWNLDSRY